jgi:hypothetical protein
MGRRRRRPGPVPKPAEERRNLLVGVKVSAREYAAFETAAAPLPVATWMRGRALEALETGSSRERIEAYLAQARALSDRAATTLAEVDGRIAARMARVDGLVKRAAAAHDAWGRAVRGRRPVARGRK